MEKIEKTFVVKIYLAGDINVIKQEIRKYCYRIGLCVTVNETIFIYTAGEEYGVEIGFINYPRFPDTEDAIVNKAIELADICRNATYQNSYLVMTPSKTIYNSNRVEK